LIIEGATDQAVFEHAARLSGTDLGSIGVVTVPVSKPAQPIAIAILRSLAIPTYAVFDADSNGTDREHAAKENAAILGALQVDGEPEFPDTGNRATWACFSENLESFLEDEVDGFREQIAEAAADLGWKVHKSPEVYAETIDRLGMAAVPPLVNAVLERVTAAAA